MSLDAEACVIRDLIDSRAAAQPDAVAVLFTDGPQWRWAELRDKIRERAGALRRLGVRQDEFVLSWLPNGPQAVLTFLALNYLGAVYVPVNVAYRGGVLQHVIANAGASLMIAHGALIGRLRDVETAALRRIVVLGDERPDLAGVELIGGEALYGGGEPPVPPRPLRPWDTHMVIYTSGTTGPSKGVLCSYRHSAAAARGFRNIGAGDRNFTALPMHHVGGVYGLLWAMLYEDASVVMAETFKTDRFWEIVRRHEVTTTGLLGAMVRFLLAQPPSPGDGEHTLRSVIVAPYDEAAVAFSERFGVDVYTEFNMTELSVPLWGGPERLPPGACGRPRPGLELRLVDANDIEVEDGAAGELVLRADEPWTMSHGYHNDPATTARAWRNGWFHTGDLFRCDAGGNYHFIDRAKDALRRRGENISSFEVESAIMLHPAIAEAAVVAAPAADGEDEVLAVIVAKPGDAFDPAELLAFLQPRLAHFMLPRYVRRVADLPRTPTHKVEKHRLRAEGVTADTWDREAAGVQVRRETLERR